MYSLHVDWIFKNKHYIQINSTCFKKHSAACLPSTALCTNVLWAWSPVWVMGISTPGSDSGSSHVCWPNESETLCEKVSTWKRCDGLSMCGCSSSPVRWHVWTRRGCRPASRYLYSVMPGRLECSRSEGSGQPFLLRRPASRAGEETKRWPLLPPGDRCTAGRVANWNCSTPVTAKQKREIYYNCFYYVQTFL